MSSFIDVVTSFPTVIFTVTLSLCFLYWIAVILGAAGEEAGVLDDGGIDAGDMGFVGTILSKIGFGGVPLMVALSVFSVVGFVISVGLSDLFSFLPSVVKFLASAVVAIPVALFLSWLATVVALTPIRWFLKRVKPAPKMVLLGRVGVVKMDVGDGKVGEVEVDDGAAGLIFFARAPDGEFYPKGSEVVLVEIDSETNTAIVNSKSDFGSAISKF